MKSYLFPGTSLPMVIEASSSEYSSFDNLCAFVSKHSTELFSNLYRYGAILFRGFAVTEVTQFETFAKLSVPKLTTYRGGDSPRHRVNRYIYTSTEFPAEYPIPLHNELSYSRRYPRLIFFFCYTPVARGGRTPLLDGRKLYKLLDSRIIETFARKKLKYVQNLHAGIGFGKSWQDTFETDDREVVERHLREVGAIAEWKSSGGLRVEEIVSPIIKHPVTGEKVFFSQADQWHSSSLDEETRTGLLELISENDLYHNCFYGDGSPLNPQDLDDIRYLSEQKKVCFSWQHGDLLIVDNRQPT